MNRSLVWLGFLGLWACSSGAGGPPPAPAPAPAQALATALATAPPPGGAEGISGGKGEGDAGPPPGVSVDPERGEVRIDSWFVNPTQRIEVFGCHESGPTHETVVAFRATGEEIYRALVELGLRAPAFWNATGPDEIRRNLGDRVVVFLRWERDGEARELPAERILREAGTGFKPFVGGFTFAAEKVALGDPPVPQIPRAVEITIGDPNRQNSVFSVLFHPRDLAELTPWVAPLEIDPEALPDLAALAERKAPCTLVIRRFAGEAEFLSIARRCESDAERRGLLDRLQPLAAEIDRLKAGYAALVGEIEKSLQAGGDPGKLSDEDRKRFQEKVDATLRRGRLQALRIRERYLALFNAQEAMRVSLLEKQAGLDPEVLEDARDRYRHGFAFEVQIALHQVATAEIDAGPQPPPEGDRLRREVLGWKIKILDLERTGFWARSHLGKLERRMATLDPQSDSYTLELLREDELRTRADIRRFGCEADQLSSRIEENEARLQEQWEGRQGEILRRRRRAELGSRLGEAELELADLLGDLRWARNLLEDEKREQEEILKNLEEVKRLQVKKQELEARIQRMKSEYENPPPGS